MQDKVISVVGTMFFKDGKLLIDKPRKRPTFQMIGGSVELDASGALVNLNGTVFEKESLKQIGDCRLTTINLWKAENVSYRTEISTLIDEITTAINNGTIEEV